MTAVRVFIMRSNRPPYSPLPPVREVYVHSNDVPQPDQVSEWLTVNGATWWPVADPAIVAATAELSDGAHVVEVQE